MWHFRGPISVTGAGAFFLFAWIVQLLFNSIVVGHFGLLAPLNYWQAATLLFLFMLLFAWSGWGRGGVTRGILRLHVGDLFGLEVGLFFLFAWVFQLLFNSLVVGYFGLLSPLNYWQAAGLLFLAAIFTAWTGFVAGPVSLKKADYSEIGRRIKEELKRFFEEW